MTSRDDAHRRGAGLPSTPPEWLSEAQHARDEEERLRAARLLRDAPAEETIPALLGTLVRERPDTWMIEEAAHILRHLQLPEFHGALAPVIAACEHSTRDVEVPVQAEVALLAISRSAEGAGL